MSEHRKSVFLTGATGFLGQATAKELLKQGYLVNALTHRGSKVPDGCTPAYADITDAEAISEFIARNDMVLHLAGIVGNDACNADIANAIRVNVSGSLNVFDGMSYFNKPGVYVGVGNADDITIYSITKTTGERFAHMFNKEHGARILPVRLFNVYGPGQSAKTGKLIPKAIAAAKQNQPIEVYGDGSLLMDFIHVDDAAFLLVKALEASVTMTDRPETLHIGTANGVSISDAAQIVIRKAQSKSEVKYLSPRTGELAPKVVADRELIFKVPGFAPRDLNSGIETVFN